VLVIKISRPDQRIIERASTEPELRGVRQLILDKIAIAETMKEFGKTVPEEKRVSLGWQKAFAVAQGVLGKAGVTMPPYPDNSWYARVGGVIRREGMTEDSVRELAQYCKDNLRQPTSFDFMICQQHRIRTGEFNVVKRAPDIVPEMPLLPED
jgi:hypothetical protein